MNDKHQDRGANRAAGARLEGIITSAMDAIISVDEQQKIILFNPAAEEMFGVPASEALGTSINRFIPLCFRSAHPQQVGEFGATGATHRRMGQLGTVSGLRANGEEFPAEASISQINTAQGRVYTVIMRDISARRAAEGALLKAHEDLERLVQERTARLRDTISELQHMSYSITHDMRAPLRAIQSFAGILEQEIGSLLSIEHRQYLEMMKAASNRMDALIRDVLAYGDIVQKELPVAPVNVNALLSSVIATYPLFQPPAARIEIAPDMPLVCGNEALLTQCFSNLLSNAIKFAKPGQVPVVKISGHNQNGWVRLSFQDDGIGIPPGLHRKIFGIFQRLNNARDGTGIGLAIVRKAVERMEGTVSVDSLEGQGATFHLYLLPVAEPPVSQGA